MSNISLNGGQFHITDNRERVYTVLKGQVLVYIVPLKEKEDGTGEKVPGRRKFLREASEGEQIPALCHDSEMLGSWRMELIALDHAEISEEVGVPGEELILSFAERINLKISDAEEFEEELIERYNLEAVKEEFYIFATSDEEENTIDRSLRLIYEMFRSGAEDTPFTPAGHALYDTVAYICRKEKINIASLQRVKDCSGFNFSIQDIARVSHFTVREVALEEGWYKRDNGILLAFREEDGKPVACIPKGPRRYDAYDPETGTSRRIDKKFADGLKLKGYLFYRPFPERKIGKLDLLRFGMSKVYVSDLLRLFLLALLGTAIGLLLPFMNQQVYDRFIPMGDASGLAALGAVILACSLGNITFTIVKNLAMFRSMNSMKYAAQSATIDRLFNLPASFFREYDAADLAQRAMGISSIYQVLAQNITTAALTAFFSLLYLFRMFKYSKDMSKTSLILLAVVVLIMLWLGIRQTRLEKTKMEVDIEASNVIFQYLEGIEKLRISASENRSILRYLTLFTRSRSIDTRKERTTLIVNTVVDSVQILFSVVFYYMMIHKNIGLSIGQFTGFTAAFGSFSAAMLSVVQNFLSVNMVKPLYENAKPILETLPECLEDAALPGDLMGEIEVDNVTFAYGESEAPVLNGVSFHLKPGEYVAVVGSSGCGKSTLLKLLLGFEKPQLGKIYYDGMDIDGLDKRELRKKFGVVLQDGGAISGSIYENITITAPNAKMSRVEQTVREVGLEEDIAQMPMGLHTVMSEGGGTISGGQLQRILIARAIVGKPKIIFLDEATSALDNVTQGMVMDTLGKLPATRLVIAHRLSTVQHCDRIFVMDKGRIVEEGNYEELMDKRGLFYDLAIRQVS